jgi:hypothetical protein
MLHAMARWKATIHMYRLKKFQNFQEFIAFIVACPRTQKPISINIVLFGLRKILYFYVDLEE